LSRESLTIPNAWLRLRQFTPARIALGRAGGSIPTSELLDFQLAHARARDAVHAPFDVEALAAQIAQLGISTICVTSAAPDRETFLKRPDLGRRLDMTGHEALELAAAAVGPCDSSPASMTAGQQFAIHDTAQADLAIIVSDGLSALAVQRQVVPLLAAWLPLLRAEQRRVAPLVLIERGRVAIQDEVGQLLNARVAVILVGERPGLGSPDSLGAYLVYAPRAGLTDADRNCVSNIRPQGLPPAAAALKLHYLMSEAIARRTSGVALKDESLSVSRVDDASQPSAAQIGANTSNADPGPW
jgi:ethanolamine ammonia-lyase small subunit